MATTFKASEFQKVRQSFVPTLPQGLQSSNSKFAFTSLPVPADIKEKYPLISDIQYVEFQPSELENPSDISPLRIGVVLSGGQAPGGHNVIMGVYDYLKRHHPSSQVFGFLSGPRGIYTNSFKEVDHDLMQAYRNQGGFDMICSGRDKIETEEQYANSLKYCTALNLDGLIVIGGDDSNTNAALLAEYFLKHNSSVKVIGCPKTIDGDLKNEYIEVSFGFDTACKTYSQLIGNVCLDAASTKKYYHFVRLMGRSASHIALECELQTRANLVLIGEEVQAKNQTLSQIVAELSDMIFKRGTELNKSYGVVLVPEGLIEFIPEVNVLIKELNELMVGVSGTESELRDFVSLKLTPESAELFSFLPSSIGNQLLLDRDPHGNVQVAKIETERLLIMLVESELARRGYNHAFLAQSYYFGYEGRSCLPSNFDATYCYALGYTAGSLIKYGFTGCMAVCRGLTKPPSEWKSAGCPLATMMNIERRKGKPVAVIKKALVELDSEYFQAYAKVRETWKYNDCYRIPGPIQFEGVGSDSYSFILKPPTEAELACVFEADHGFPYFPRVTQNLSPLMQARTQAEVDLPLILSKPHKIVLGETLENDFEETLQAIKDQLPELSNNKLRKYAELEECKEPAKSAKIGILYLGRQAPGAHNIIHGILHELEHSGGTLFGFLGGNQGLTNESYFKITKENFALYKNTGGVDFLGRTGNSIRPHDFEKVKNTCKSLSLDGLVIVGATHALTDAAYLAEYFIAQGEHTKVIAVPMTVDNNINHQLFETCLGFDTASRVNAELVGNMMTDAASATKYYYFIRVMGQDPSHLAVECALQTHPNIVLVSEYHKNEGNTLMDVVRQVSDTIQERAKHNKHFGTVLVPEGLLQQLSHFRELIGEINSIMGHKTRQDRERLANELVKSPERIDEVFHHYSAPVLRNLPSWFQLQLLTRIDSNGHVQQSLIETERLLSDLVAHELKERKKTGSYKGSFAPVCHFFGYQGRCSFPTTFDCSLGSCYGAVSVSLVRSGVTGYLVTARGLNAPVSQWRLGGIPISVVMKLKGKSQYGRNRVVAASHEVDLYSKAYQKVASEAKAWALIEHYSNPGPIQFDGVAKDAFNLTLKVNYEGYLVNLRKVQELCQQILNVCRFGVHDDLLKTAVIGLTSVEDILNLHRR